VGGEGWGSSHDASSSRISSKVAATRRGRHLPTPPSSRKAWP